MNIKIRSGLASLALLLLVSGCAVISGRDPLAGTSWALTMMDGKLPIATAAPTLRFEDGQVSGNASCNSFGGSYQVKGDRIEFGDMAWTLMACLDDGVMDQEQMYMKLLGEAERFERSGDRLVIITAAGEQLVSFEPVN